MANLNQPSDSPRRRAVARGRYVCLAGLILTLLNSGCVSYRLNSARREFYNGNLAAAAESLQELPQDPGNKILYLMERGTILQAQQDYRSANFDFLAAANKAEELDYYSLSQGAASFVINDRVKAFRGAPYERTLLHAFTAKNYLAQAMWDDAGVEARIMLERLDNLDGFPYDLYSHYLAAVCLELMGDYDAATFQYRKLAEEAKNPEIDARSGRFAGVEYGDSPAELICFVLIGRAPTEHGDGSQVARWGAAPFAEIYSGAQYLGRSYSLNTTRKLLAQTEQRVAVLKAAKTVTRVIIKDSLAHVAAEKDQTLGLFVWLLLFALEQPDLRRWETLPAWLQVARVPCPADLNQYEIRFKTGNGTLLRTRTVTTPLQRSRNSFVSFVRDFP